MSIKPLTLSIIIPAYNEERHLPACLDSIANQTVSPDEVIVVDNNSTDNTAKIAKSYDFVTLVHEKTQGLIAARNKGLNIAKGDLLARIDADAVLSKDWVETIHKTFSADSVDTITGPARICLDTHLPFWQTTLWSKVYFRYALATYRINVLWGPNMVMRRKVWDTIHDETTTKDRAVHEDQDISVLTRLNGFNIKIVPELVISTDGRRFASVSKGIEYSKRHRATLLMHRYNLKRIEPEISVWKAKFWELILIPLGVLLATMSAVYSIELALKLRKT